MINEVVKFSRHSGVVVANQSEGYGLNQLKDPDGIYVDSSGNIYIADAGSKKELLNGSLVLVKV